MSMSVKAASVSTVNTKLDIDGNESTYYLESHNQLDNGDVHAFENALHSDPLAESVFGKVDHVSNSLAGKKVEFEHALKKAADTSNPADITNSMRIMSEYALQTAMVAKIAGKTSQSIDKLTNLH